ncbi:hypothetical protein BZA70DRAFT_20530 [Myxozyma melibiosi]|uniref:Uncharacterized protein n=1 Tax=Myxozyma melibiosi TaxID=54550 RepID=A0ABR1FCQ0_9ASCO
MAPPNNHSHLSSKAGQGFNTPESSRNAGKGSSLNLESFAYHERQLPTVLTPTSGGARGQRSSAPSIGSGTRNNPASTSEANGIGSRSRISTPALSHIEDNTIDHPSPTPSRAKFGRTNVVRPIPVYGIGSPEHRPEKEAKANRSPYFKSPAPRIFQRYESSPVARSVPHPRHSNGNPVRQHPESPGYNDGSFSSSSRTRFPPSHAMQDQNSHFHPIKRPATSSGYGPNPAHRGAGMYRTPSAANTPISLSRPASRAQFEAAPGMRTTVLGAARSGGSSVLSQTNGHSALTNIRNVRRVPFNRS